jgi:hypothetical protein
LSNKRSIDKDIKEFFAIKNMAHQKFENQFFEQMITDATQRNYTDISYRTTSQHGIPGNLDKSHSTYMKT